MNDTIYLNTSELLTNRQLYALFTSDGKYRNLSPSINPKRDAVAIQTLFKSGEMQLCAFDKTYPNGPLVDITTAILAGGTRSSITKKEIENFSELLGSREYSPQFKFWCEEDAFREYYRLRCLALSQLLIDKYSRSSPELCKHANAMYAFLRRARDLKLSKLYDLNDTFTRVDLPLDASAIKTMFKHCYTVTCMTLWPSAKKVHRSKADARHSATIEATELLQTLERSGVPTYMSGVEITTEPKSFGDVLNRCQIADIVAIRNHRPSEIKTFRSAFSKACKNNNVDSSKLLRSFGVITDIMEDQTSNDRMRVVDPVSKTVSFIAGAAALVGSSDVASNLVMGELPTIWQCLRVGSLAVIAGAAPLLTRTRRDSARHELREWRMMQLREMVDAKAGSSYQVPTK